MSNLTFTGKFVKHYDEKSGVGKTGKDWNSIKFVLSTEDQYNPIMAFSTMKLVHEIKSLAAGQEVTVHYNNKCNEYNGNYYVSLDAWKIETGAVAQPSQAAQPTQSGETVVNPHDDLPF